MSKTAAYFREREASVAGVWLVRGQHCFLFSRHCAHRPPRELVQLQIGTEGPAGALDAAFPSSSRGDTDPARPGTPFGAVRP